MTTGPCPCGSGQPYADCCAPFHRGEKHAPTAEALMRSRFSAFALDDVAYLRDTWHPSTRPRRLEPDSTRTWTGLDVKRTTGGRVFDSEGTVEFEAHYVAAGQPGVQREHSTFVRENKRWFYVSAL